MSPKAKGTGMNKGDETPHGIYLGEAMVDRPTRLSPEEAAETLADYEAKGHTDVVADPDSPTNNYETREQAAIPILELLQDRAIAYVFDSDGTEVVILVEDFA